jgi:hypothetical protein
MEVIMVTLESLRERSIMSTKKARDLVVGDVFRLHVYGEVLAVARVAEGKRIKVKIELENQGRRDNCGLTFSGKSSGLEFTDAGYLLEFLCRPSRTFHVYSDGWNDDSNDNIDVDPTPATQTDRCLMMVRRRGRSWCKQKTDRAAHAHARLQRQRTS